MSIDKTNIPKRLVDQIRETAEAIGGRLCYHDVLILLIDPEDDALVHVAAAGPHGEVKRQCTLEREELRDREKRVLDRMAVHEGTLLVNDMSQQPNHVPLFPGARSELHVRIQRSGRLLGVLSVGCRRPDAYDEIAASTMEALADQVAVAIENAVAYNRQSASSEYFRSMVNGLQDQVMVIDRDYRIDDVNCAFLQRLGHTREEVIGRRCHEVVYQRSEPCDGVEFTCPLEHAWESREPVGSFHIHRDQAGKQTHFRVSALPVCDAQGQVAKIIAACIDVTAEHRLEEKLAAVYALGQDLVLSRDVAEIAQIVVKAAEQVLQIQVCSLLLIDAGARTLVCWARKPTDEVSAISPLSLDGARGIAVTVVRTGEAIYLPDSSGDPLYPGGRPMTRSRLCVPLMVRERVIGVLCAESEKAHAFGEDDRHLFSALADQAALAIENARLFEMVSQQREQLRALAAQLAEGEEAERKWLAQELHDQVGQNLAALGINLNIVRSQWPGAAVGMVQSRVDDSLALVEQTTERIRALMVDLRPPVLDDYGLVAALRWHGEQCAARGHVSVTVQGEEPSPRLAPPTEVALFRIAQEALANVSKHSQAAQVRVSVEEDHDTVRLIVADDGIGFDRASLASPDGTPGWGLLTMTQRAEAVGGRCRIESRPGCGTRVVVEVPR